METPFDSEERTPRGHDVSLLRELQEITAAERIERNCRMAELVEQLRLAGEAHESQLGASRGTSFALRPWMLQ
jgi:hypothetical protein